LVSSRDNVQLELEILGKRNNLFKSYVQIWCMENQAASLLLISGLSDAVNEFQAGYYIG
jgi:hypothetical protein